VVGHRNPDTDSICSAIAYAELKKRITGKDYLARRAGAVNDETQSMFWTDLVYSSRHFLTALRCR